MRVSAARERLSGVAPLLLVLGCGAAAEAPTPTETVKAFYEHPGLETDPAARDRFADPALTILNQNDAIRKTGQDGCLDPGLAVDNPTFDGDELSSTLKLGETVSGEEARVFATFTVFHDPRRMVWKLKKVDGVWKVSDLMSISGEWTLSQFGCE